MVHGQPYRAVGVVWLYMGSASPHARRHSPSRLGHNPRFRAGRTRTADTGDADWLDHAHAHSVGCRLSRHGRAAMSPIQTMRTPMRRVRGLGTARSGTGQFWHQRITSVAGIPLTIGLLLIITALLGRSHAAVVQILGSPLVAITVLLFIINTAYHMWIGMQEIILDYIHEEKWKLLSLIANTFFVFVVSLASIYAILKLSFGV